MRDSHVLRRKMMLALLVMGGLDLLALVLLLSPLTGSPEARRAELSQLWNQLRLETRQVEPLRGLDKKIVDARSQIAEFYQDRLPGQQSSISEELGKLAAAHTVKIAQTKYDTKDTEEQGLRPVLIEASMSGDYVRLVEFVNGLERDQMFFIVNSVNLGEAQGNQVKLQLKLETYLRTKS
jgi:hypothetical protein